MTQQTNLTQAIDSLRRSEKDTGSSEVQIGLLTQKIKLLTEHFKKHKKDYHSQRGLLKMVSKRKKLLNYIKEKDSKVYQKAIQGLSLRK